MFHSRRRGDASVNAIVVVLIIIALGVGIYMWFQRGKVMEPVVVTPEVTVPVVVQEDLSTKGKLENFANYTVVTDVSRKDIVPVCGEYSENFAKRVKEGEVKELVLYKSMSGNWDLTVYLTPNYDTWTEAAFSQVNDCGEGGSIVALKAFPDAVMWGLPACSLGAIPAKTDKEYSEFQGCESTLSELNKYLGKVQ